MGGGCQLRCSGRVSRAQGGWDGAKKARSHCRLVLSGRSRQRWGAGEEFPVQLSAPYLTFSASTLSDPTHSGGYLSRRRQSSHESQGPSRRRRAFGLRAQEPSKVTVSARMVLNVSTTTRLCGSKRVCGLLTTCTICVDTDLYSSRTQVFSDSIFKISRSYHTTESNTKTRKNGPFRLCTVERKA